MVITPATEDDTQTARLRDLARAYATPRASTNPDALAPPIIAGQRAQTGDDRRAPQHARRPPESRPADTDAAAAWARPAREQETEDTAGASDAQNAKAATGTETADRHRRTRPQLAEDPHSSDHDVDTGAQQHDADEASDRKGSTTQAGATDKFGGGPMRSAGTTPLPSPTRRHWTHRPKYQQPSPLPCRH